MADRARTQPNRRPGRPTRAPRPVTLTEVDLELLRFASEHRFVLADHAAVLLGVAPAAAQRRLGRLAGGGYLQRARVLSAHPAMHLITRAGLAAVGSSVRPPRVDVHAFAHDVGVAWLFLAARRGTFGPVREILAERTLRSRDAARDPELEPLAVRKGGTGPGGREQLHYPDLLLRTADGRWIALELELSGKARTKLESILSAYGADPRIAGVVYLVQTQTVARSIEQAARKVGVTDLIHLQRVRSKVSTPAATPARALERGPAVAR